MVNMWATWCPPCVRELPAIERLATKFKAEDFALLPISIDAEGKQQIRFYQIDLTLVNTDDNRKVWTGQKKLKKDVKAATFR